jgi:hypothetical protein
MRFRTRHTHCTSGRRRSFSCVGPPLAGLFQCQELPKSFDRALARFFSVSSAGKPFCGFLGMVISYFLDTQPPKRHRFSRCAHRGSRCCTAVHGAVPRVFGMRVTRVWRTFCTASFHFRQRGCTARIFGSVVAPRDFSRCVAPREFRGILENCGRLFESERQA